MDHDNLISDDNLISWTHDTIIGPYMRCAVCIARANLHAEEEQKEMDEDDDQEGEDDDEDDDDDEEEEEQGGKKHAAPAGSPRLKARQISRKQTGATKAAGATVAAMAAATTTRPGTMSKTIGSSVLPSRL